MNELTTTERWYLAVVAFKISVAFEFEALLYNFHYNLFM